MAGGNSFYKNTLEYELVHIHASGTGLYHCHPKHTAAGALVKPGDTTMFTKSTIALAIVLATMTGSLAATKRPAQHPAQVNQSQTLDELSAKIRTDTFMHD
jgi:hypothetical protein